MGTESAKRAVFENNVFSPDRVGDQRVASILFAAADSAAGLVRPSNLLAAAIETGDAKVLTTLGQALEPGATPADLLQVIRIYNPPRTSPALDFDGRRHRFSEAALAALDEFGDALGNVADGTAEATLPLLVGCVLSHLEDEDLEYLTSLDAKRGADMFSRQAHDVTADSEPVFDGAGRLRAELLSEAGLAAMEQAAFRAADLGYDRIMPPHCFLALLGETEGVAEYLVRLQAQPNVGPAKVGSIVADAFRLSDQKGAAPELSRQGIGEATADLLTAAQKAARAWGSERADTTHLLLALLDNMPARLASVLVANPLSFDLRKMHQQIEQRLLEERTQPRREVAFRLPPGTLHSDDLTYRARTGDMMPALHLDSYFEAVTRALYRRANNHVLVTGGQGVGKSALVLELARRAATGEIPFLSRKRFLWVDGGDVPPDESRSKLNAILAHVGGRTDLILCLDGLGPLLRAESGANNKAALRAALRESRVHLIGVMSNADYEDLFSSDHTLLEFFTRVDVHEPETEAAVEIVRQAAAGLAQEYGLTINDRAVERAVVLSAGYILNERLPRKAIKILRRVCENLEFARTQLKDERSMITADDVIGVIAEISGVPRETLEGVTGEVNYEESLARFVVGQDDAVKAVATELGLIKAGLTRPKKPASVMLFAGLTGVGKTELAKAVAQLYSSSKMLQTYTMGNYTEAHSISAIIGVPPGYVGHEQGGRLINDLNSDPYCVVLLDEADKPHPDVWKPFLNLFDEGWIVDQRGVKAFGDRSIFILTTNAGHEIISEMSRAGGRPEDIAKEVRQALLKVRDERSGQPKFSPEFLARVTRILIFRPLDRDAMEGICRKLLGQMQRDWQERREKTLIVPDNLIAYIAMEAHRLDEAAGFNEGGRVVSKLLNDLVQAQIQSAAASQQRAFKDCNVIELAFVEPGLLPMQRASGPKVSVLFRSDRPAAVSDCVAHAIADLERLVRSGAPGSGVVAPSAVAECLARLEACVQRGGQAADVQISPADYEPILGQFRKTCAELERTVRRSEQELKTQVEELVVALGAAAPVERT
jgi:ATP-dependent Clp protease ATP-binding subunit ClpA